ncbi:MAG: hypothetical protein ABSA16_17450 [Thermoguttaceae bacterium]
MMQDRETQMRAAASAVQQAELAKQQQRQLKRLQGRRTRRLVYGILLTWIGGFMVIGMIGMFFSSPTPGYTAEQQKFSAVICGTLFGLVPLASGIALLLAARSAKRSPLATQDADDLLDSQQQKKPLLVPILLSCVGAFVSAIAAVVAYGLAFGPYRGNDARGGWFLLAMLAGGAATFFVVRRRVAS